MRFVVISSVLVGCAMPMDTPADTEVAEAPTPAVLTLLEEASEPEPDVVAPAPELVSAAPEVEEVAGMPVRACRCYRCWAPDRRGTLLDGRCKCPPTYSPTRGICCRLPRHDSVLDVPY